MFRSHLKITLRNMKRHKSYSFINIAGLAVGMAFAILILLWVRFELSFEKFQENLDQLYMVAFTGEKNEFYGDGTVGALSAYLENEYPEIIHSTRFSGFQGWRFEYDGKKYTGYGRYVDPSFFEMFSFPFILGNSETALADPYSIVITEQLAKRIFGDEDPVGKALKVSDETVLAVTAVMDDVPVNTRFRFNFLVSCEIGPESYKEWDIKCISTYVMLDKNCEYREVSDKIRDVYNMHNTYDTKNYLFLQPLKDVHLHALGGGGRYVYVLIFSSMAAVILLIACINFMNLSTARSEMRFKEIGVKKVVGASRMQLVVQFLSESVLLSFIALLVAIVIVELLLPVVNGMFRLQFDLDYSGKIVLSLLGIAFLTGIISGSYPAFFLSSFQPVSVLKGRASLINLPGWRFGRDSGGHSGGSSLRKILVVVQFAVSIILIVCAVIIFRQLDYMRKMDTGFEKERIVLFDMPGTLRLKTETVKNELLKHSNIHGITVSSNSLVRWWTSFSIAWEGKRPDQTFDMGFNTVDYDYLETFQMEMVEGRFFSIEFRSDAREAYIVNEAAVEAMGVADPVGRRITLAPSSSWERQGTIIGVIKNYNTESAHNEIRPFMLGLTSHGNFMCARIGSEDIPGTLEFMRNKVREIVPDVNISPRFFNDEMESLYAAEELTGAVIVYITVLAVFISCLGLFGLAAYTAERRTKEVGIRKVLGASVGSIVQLLLKEFVLLVILASAIACPVSYYIMNAWLRNFAYRTAINPWLFGVVTALILFIALGAVGFQAAKAANANPVDALRYE